MNQNVFKAELAASGYAIEDKDLGPRPAAAEHVHDHDIRGLVLSGIFAVWQNQRVTKYHPGEIFDVPAGVMHTEEIGKEGATVIIGRRSKPPQH